MADAALQKTTPSSSVCITPGIIAPAPRPAPYPTAGSPAKAPLAHDIDKWEGIRDRICQGAEALSKKKGPFQLLGKIGHYTCQTAKYSEKIAENPGEVENKMTHWAHRNLPNFLVRGLEFFIQLGE